LSVTEVYAFRDDPSPAAALGAAILLRSMLFGARSWDPPTLIAVAVVLAVFAVLAAFVPARAAPRR